MRLNNIFSFSRTKWQKNIVPFPTDLTNIQSIKIMNFKDASWAEFSKQDIEKFLSFMKKGSYNKMLKSATRFQIRIQHEGGTSDYYVHGESLAPEPGGLVQATFIPKERGFELFLYTFF